MRVCVVGNCGYDGAMVQRCLPRQAMVKGVQGDWERFCEVRSWYIIVVCMAKVIRLFYREVVYRWGASVVGEEGT